MEKNRPSNAVPEKDLFVDIYTSDHRCSALIQRIESNNPRYTTSSSVMTSHRYSGTKLVLYRVLRLVKIYNLSIVIDSIHPKKIHFDSLRRWSISFKVTCGESDKDRISKDFIRFLRFITNGDAHKLLCIGNQSQFVFYFILSFLKIRLLQALQVLPCLTISS